MEISSEKKISNLLNLIDTKKKSKEKIDILNSIETINGYDLIFILALAMRDNFSGNLIIVDEENLLSSITFIYGDIVKIDFPDKEHLLGNLAVENEIISKFEMQEIIEKRGGLRLGEYLMKNHYITPAQLRSLLFSQTKLRLSKYLNSLNVRIKFTFDGESNDSVLMSKVDLADVLYKWIFQNFKNEWLNEYSQVYSKTYFNAYMSTDQLQILKDHPEMYGIAYKITQFKKDIISYNEISLIVCKAKIETVKIIHFMLTSGALTVAKTKEVENLNKIKEKKGKDLLEALESDLKKIQLDLLSKKYFDAFGTLNKYSSLKKTNPKVNFYFIWIKLMGAYYSSHLIDINKVSQDLHDLDYYKVNAGEFYYVRALLYAVERKYKESDESYQRAISYGEVFKKFPINNDETSFMKRIYNFFGGSKKKQP